METPRRIHSIGSRASGRKQENVRCRIMRDVLSQKRTIVLRRLRHLAMDLASWFFLRQMEGMVKMMVDRYVYACYPSAALSCEY